jgi:alpha-tubulin suppressor-like RCC1 family protein
VGYNGSGELGVGTTINQPVPVQVLPDGVQTVTASFGNSLILKTDGSLWGMGDNNYGQLGNGTTNYLSPVQVLSGGVQAVAAGAYDVMILKTDGSLWAVGYNNVGQLGDGTTSSRTSPEQILPGGVRAAATSGAFSLIVKTDGSLWAMGDNSVGELGDWSAIQRNSPVKILAGGVQSVAAGYTHSLILETDASLWGNGYNGFGQLGSEPTLFNVGYFPQQILPGGVQAVVGGEEHSLVLMKDGSLWAMGDNTYGQLGDGTTIQRNAPVEVFSGGVQAIGSSGYFSLFLKTDGCLWATGDNRYGQFGDATTTGRTTPEPIAINVLDFSAGFFHSLIVAGGPIGVAPAFTIQPVNQTAAAGGTVTFSATASGLPLPSGRWQLLTHPGPFWTDLGDTLQYIGTTTSTLKITGVTTDMNGFQYRFVTANATGSVTSNPAKLAISTDQVFLRQLFLDVLQRQIDSGGLASFGAALAGGESRAAVLGDLLGSAEYQSRQIEPAIRLYYAALARSPDYAGLQNWSNALRAGALTLAEAGNQFASSTEFLQDYGNLDNTGSVQQLYLNVLGRPADPAGLANWVGELNAGASRGRVLIGFSESPEFQADMANQVEIVRLFYLLEGRMSTASELQGWITALNGDQQTDTLFARARPAGLPDSAYVQAVFQGFLCRDADAGALNTFAVGLAARMVTHDSLVDTALNSTEFSSYVGPVSRLYLAAFNRIPDQPGMINWVNYAKANSLQSVVDTFTASQEFINLYGGLSDTAYVTALYQNVLGRAPDHGGLDYWTGLLVSGTSRGGVLIGFSQSPEGISLFAPTLRTFLSYYAFFNSAPAQSDLTYWNSYLTTLDDQMRNNLLADMAITTGS